MEKHYEEQVVARYLGHRQYEVTAQEVLVTKNEKGEDRREVVRQVTSLFDEPTILDLFFDNLKSFLTLDEMRSFLELYEANLAFVVETFNICDFDKISNNDVRKAVEKAEDVAGRRSLPRVH